MACPTFATGVSRICLLLTDAMAPVRSFFRMVPYPTTTTSSIWAVSSSSVISRCVRLFKGILCERYPMNEISSSAFGSAESENAPSIPDEVPEAGFFRSTIEAPTTGFPAASRIVPFTVIFWAMAGRPVARARRRLPTQSVNPERKVWYNLFIRIVLGLDFGFRASAAPRMGLCASAYQN